MSARRASAGGLTGRGLAVLAGGIAVGVAGWLVGQPPLLAAGAFGALLPLLAALGVRRTQVLLGSTRTVDTSRLPLGEAADVVLTVENASRWSTGALLLEDEVPARLGESTRLLLDRVPPRAVRSVRYPMIGRERGRARLGPLAVTVRDAFGMAEVTHAFDTTTPILVTPRIVDLSRAGSSLTPGGRGDSRVTSISARGDDDVLPREHRPGDDVRRIHWRATARSGDLMVRREEQAWQSALVVILDNRANAHSGSGPDSTFEWAVSAAASVCLHFRSVGWDVTAVSADGAVLVDPHSGADGILTGFGEVRTTLAGMSPAITAATEGASAVVAVVGRVTEDAARALVRPATGFAAALVLAPGPTGALLAQGWRIAEWTRGASVPDVWAQVGASRVPS